MQRERSDPIPSQRILDPIPIPTDPVHLVCMHVRQCVCVRAAYDAVGRARSIAHQSACVDLYNADEPAAAAGRADILGRR